MAKYLIAALFVLAALLGVTAGVCLWRSGEPPAEPALITTLQVQGPIPVGARMRSPSPFGIVGET